MTIVKSKEFIHKNHALRTILTNFELVFCEASPEKLITENRGNLMGARNIRLFGIIKVQYLLNRNKFVYDQRKVFFVTIASICKVLSVLVFDLSLL